MLLFLPRIPGRTGPKDELRIRVWARHKNDDIVCADGGRRWSVTF